MYRVASAHTVSREGLCNQHLPLLRCPQLKASSGGGYPDGKSRAQIPRGAQVVAVCDSFDAMTNVRPYGRMRSRDAALAELQRCAGTQFDPDVVRAFQSAMARMPSGSPGVLERALA